VCQEEREPPREGVTLIRRKSLEQLAHVVVSAIEDQNPSEEQACHRVRLIHLKHLSVRINRLLEVALHNVCKSRHTLRDRGERIYGEKPRQQRSRGRNASRDEITIAQQQQGVGIVWFKLYGDFQIAHGVLDVAT
jgi:hypothetical protein